MVAHSTHMASILRLWYRAGLKWKSFPYKVAGYADLKEFVIGCAATSLIPVFILRDGEPPRAGERPPRAEDAIKDMQEVCMAACIPSSVYVYA